MIAHQSLDRKLKIDNKNAGLRNLDIGNFLYTFPLTPIWLTLQEFKEKFLHYIYTIMIP